MGCIVVTDSTANLPQGLAEANGIRVVAVQVVVGSQVFDDGAPAAAERVAAELRARRPVTTSRPAPARFLNLYRQLAAEGATGIVSAHLSSELSGTFDAAVSAAEQSPVPVVVVDSRSISMGLGFACIAGARAARAGAAQDEVAEIIRRVAGAGEVLFYVDTLEHLHRGGRIGAASRWIGQALSVKPILHVVDGHVEPLEKVRTAGRALARLADLAVSAAESMPPSAAGPVAGPTCSIAVMHLDAAQRADDLAQRLRERVGGAEVVLGEVGAVIGTHVGPGMVAVVVSPPVGWK